ncbi:MAG: tyrosine--tRNA ligase [Chloroflexi bacterium]|nr:tyrosine--tRNA ligase [Chloroflexota bacterium]
MDYVLARGVIDIIPKGSLTEALESGKKLRLKLGLDPSKPDLHIGHAVLLRKLRALQEMGHQVVLIVGDWTAQIGDPSGQSVMRPMLTVDEVKANAETYMRQFFHVVDKEKTEVRWQSEWFDDFKLDEVVRLAGRFTVAQMLQREDFRQRFDAKQPLGIHELLYPLLQAYDSVAIDADVEFGGTDQLFNMLVGRELQQAMGKEPQIVFTMNLLVGTDGSQKMSKSVGNTIDLEDPPDEQYGKVMSIPDEALMSYLELATDLPDEEITYIGKQLDEKKINPMDVKKRLARDIVRQFHGDKAAENAEAEFGRVFQQREVATEMAQDVSWGRLPFMDATLLVGISASDFVTNAKQNGVSIKMASLISQELGLSMAEARRLIEQGGVEVDGEQTKSRAPKVKIGSTIRIGKHRFLKIVDAP